MLLQSLSALHSLFGDHADSQALVQGRSNNGRTSSSSSAAESEQQHAAKELLSIANETLFRSFLASILATFHAPIDEIISQAQHQVDPFSQYIQAVNASEKYRHDVCLHRAAAVPFVRRANGMMALRQAVNFLNSLLEHGGSIADWGDLWFGGGCARELFSGLVIIGGACQSTYVSYCGWLTWAFALRLDSGRCERANEAFGDKDVCLLCTSNSIALRLYWLMEFVDLHYCSDCSSISATRESSY